MKCPACRHKKTNVLNSRKQKDGAIVRRLRQCEQCQHRFQTTELRGAVSEDLPLLQPKVIKKNGHVEPFNRDKLLRSIAVAIRKIDRTETSPEDITDHVENEINLAMEHEYINSHRIGELVMDSLRRRNALAFVRYASMHKEMETLADFKTLLKTLQAEAEKDDDEKR